MEKNKTKRKYRRRGKMTEDGSVAIVGLHHQSEHQLLYPETFKKNYYELYLKLLICYTRQRSVTHVNNHTQAHAHTHTQIHLYIQHIQYIQWGKWVN